MLGRGGEVRVWRRGGGVSVSIVSGWRGEWRVVSERGAVTIVISEGVCVCVCVCVCTCVVCVVCVCVCVCVCM